MASALFAGVIFESTVLDMRRSGNIIVAAGHAGAGAVKMINAIVSASPA